MKNPRGTILSMMLIIGMLLFAMSAMGHTNSVVKHNLVYSMNAPPGITVTTIIDAPAFQIVDQPISDILIARGVSVPYRGLIMQNNDSYIQLVNSDICLSNGGESILGIRCASQTNSSYINNQPIQNRRQDNQQRGANTRLEIGEYTRI